MKLLVTGGAGFIGSHLCRHLVNTWRAHVVNVDKLTYAANLSSLDQLAADPLYRFVEADICDDKALVRIVRAHRPDAIVHLAAESHVDRSIDAADDFIRTNIVGTHRLLDVARRYWNELEGRRRTGFRFVYASTDEVYGSLERDASVPEGGACDPSSPYAASKAAGDHLTRAWHRTYGLPVLTTRAANTYGPFQFPEKLIPLVTIRALEGQELPVYGTGENERDWIHVDDHVRGLCAALVDGRVGETYNITAHDIRRNVDVVRSICGVLDRLRPQKRPHASRIRFVPDRPGHDQRYAANSCKLRRETGWRPEVEFDHGLAQAVRWYVENRWWWEPIRRTVYAGGRLGLGPGANVG